jgi:ubiquinone/menaquinone biosynthesis C-methylase UbiE
MAEAGRRGFGDWLRLMFPTRRASGSAALRALYDGAASSWHGMVLRLGYIDAYRELAQSAEARRHVSGGSPWRKALDVGSGTGGFALALASQMSAGHRLDLLDISEAMLTKAHSQLVAAGFAARTIHGDLAAMRGHEATYDVVSAAHVIEHFDDPAGGIGEMARLLKPGGLLLLVVSKPHWCNTLVWLRWRHRVFPEAEVQVALQRAGFADVHVHRFQAGPPSRTSLGFAASLQVSNSC